MKGFYQTYFEIIESIENSIRERKIMSSLILLYSAIDSFSHLANRTNDITRNVFINWTEKWMISYSNLPCSGIDLYAARCGILHELISESKLSKDKKAKQIFYAWGNADINILKETIKNSDNEDECLALKLEEIFDAFKIGMSKCYEEISKYSSWTYSFNEKAAKYFVTIKNKTES
jgi:hypothetical protein